MLESYSYSIIRGDKILQPNEFKIARAKLLALAIKEHSYVTDILLRRKINGDEIILVTFDVQVSQHPQNGISEKEDIAIIVHPADDNFPEVYALRPDFKFGLPHTNTKTDIKPISLCVTEQLFSEVKHRFIPFEFIELIRDWLKYTAKGVLHGEDQPLEPFLISNGTVILPSKKIPLTNFTIEPVNDKGLFRLIEGKQESISSFCVSYTADIQKTGFIRKNPKTIKDLDEFVIINKKPLSEKIADELNSIKNHIIDNQNIFHKKLVLGCWLPIKRHDSDVQEESDDILFFSLTKTIAEIGLGAGVWSRDIENKYSYLIDKSFTAKTIQGIEIETYVPIFDFDSNSAAIYSGSTVNNNNYVMIGAGALGSQILSVFARTGFGKWTIIDHDDLLPHNLARHVLNKDSVGFNKAEKLSDQLNKLHNNVIYTPLNANFLTIANNSTTIDILTKSNAIIDVSTSIAVARLLARDFKDSISIPRISVFFNPTGKDLVILSEDKKREHRLDFIEMEYYRFIYENKELNDHLKFENKSKIRYNRNSCREITSIINQADVLELSAIGSKGIRRFIESGNASISIWKINPENDSCKYFSIEPSKWRKSIEENWKIYLCDRLIEKIKALRIEKIQSDGDKETGGVLLGSFDIERKILYVFDTIKAPSDSKESRSFFERGVKGVIDEFNKYREITDNQIQYLGEWHSHPKGCPTNPSDYDKELYDYLYKNLSKQGYPVLMAIFGDKNYKLTFKGI